MEHKLEEGIWGGTGNTKYLSKKSYRILLQ